MALIFTLFLWSLLRQRIDAGLDGPVVDVVPAGVAYPQAVVVIQPGYSDYQYQPNTPYIYNQQVNSTNRHYNNRPLCDVSPGFQAYFQTFTEGGNCIGCSSNSIYLFLDLDFAIGQSKPLCYDIAKHSPCPSSTYNFNPFPRRAVGKSA